MHNQPLSSRLQKKARIELNEVPSEIDAYLRHIRDWLKKQPHITARTGTLTKLFSDDLWLLNFLRGCKFSLQKTKQKLDNFYTTRSLFPELFENRDPFLPEIQTILKRGILIPLETEESIDVIIRWRNADPNQVPFLTFLKMGFMFFDMVLSENNVGMVNGYHIIDDLSDFSISYLQQCTPTVLKKIFLTLQNGYPIRVKGLHAINAPSHAKALMSICRPMLTKKIQSRVHIYGEDEFQDLHKYVPLSVIPKEYGGEGCSVDEIAAQWKKKLEGYREWFLEDARYGCDETKRPGKQKTTANVFGVEGSFRKLDID